MRILIAMCIVVCSALSSAAVEWTESFNGDFDQPWVFFSDDGAIPPSHTNIVIEDSALEILGNAADAPEFNLFVAGLVGLGGDGSLAFPDAVQVTGTYSPTMNNTLAGPEARGNSDIFLLARSTGASGYVLALDAISGSFDLVRSDDGDVDNIADGLIVPDYDPAASYILRMTAQGSRIRGEIFDSSMNLLLDAYAIDDTYADGFAGVGAAINNEDALGNDRTLVTARFDDLLATNENIIPMLPIFPEARLDSRTPTDEGLNAVEIHDLGTPENIRFAVDLLMNADEIDIIADTIASFDIHDFDNGDNMGSVDGPQQEILLDLFGDDDNFVQLLSGSFEIGEGDGGDYTFNFRTDDGFGMRVFYEGEDDQIVHVPFTSVSDRGLITSAGEVTYPGETGDSNVQAVIDLAEGSYSFEMVWFEMSGGAFAEVSTVPGDVLDDPGSANWVLLGDDAGLDLIDGLGSGPVNVMVGLDGDYNNSGQVEQGDLDLVLLNWGDDTPPVPEGWTNDLPDGAIDQAELDRVLLNWGNTAAATSAGAVPEPSGMVLILLAVFASALMASRKE